MADFNSTQLANAAAVPVVRNHAVDISGKLRVALFDYEQEAEGAAGSDIALVKLPAGRVRVFPNLSRYTISALGAARTLDLGHEAYIGIDGVEVAADPDEFVSATDVSTAVIADWSEAIGDVDTVLFQSRDGVTLIATVAGDVIDAGETLAGYVVYACE